MKNILKCAGWSILYFVIIFIVQFGFMMVGISNGIENEEMLNQFAINNNLLLTIFSNIVAIIIFGIIWNVKINKKQESKEEHVQNTKKNYIFLILIAFLYSLLFLMITYNIYFSGINDTITSMNYFNSKNQFLGFVLYTISILIVAPISEELLCRGIMFGELNKKFSENQAIIISAVVFGVMHLMAGGVVLAIGAIIMGIILGFAYKTTKSLPRTMFVHGVANFADIIMLFLGKISSTNLIVFTIIIAIALLSIILLYYNRNSVIATKESN
ncbi:MAG: CPBP family intramembrane metalloprotease [Clostridia bacterium]|nr:CPBP family intramembrane metalloprotease [Clostridia bacterium]